MVVALLRNCIRLISWQSLYPRYQPAPNMAVPAPRLYGQCPRCGSLLEVDQFGCLMIDGVVESCTTRVWSSQSEDGTEVPTELASDSHDEATLVQAIALVAMEPMDAALATALLDAAAPNAAATVAQACRIQISLGHIFIRMYLGYRVILPRLFL